MGRRVSFGCRNTYRRERLNKIKVRERIPMDEVETASPALPSAITSPLYDKSISQSLDSGVQR